MKEKQRKPESDDKEKKKKRASTLAYIHAQWGQLKEKVREYNIF